MGMARWLSLAMVAVWAGCGGSGGSDLASAGPSRAEAASDRGGVPDGDDDGKDGDVLLCPCKVTGGGFVFLDGEKATFGFVAQPTDKRDPELVDGAFAAKGNLQLNLHEDDAKFHGRVSTIACLVDETTGDVEVTFGGTLRDDGAFSTTVVDEGEPGRADTFAFTGGGEDFGPLPLEQGGNIQLHEIFEDACVPVDDGDGDDECPKTECPSDDPKCECPPTEPPTEPN